MSKEKTLRTSEETEVMQATGVPAQETEEVSAALATEIIADLKKQLEEAKEEAKDWEGPFPKRAGVQPPFRYGQADTGVPFTFTSKCRWLPVELPVEPTYPISWPWVTNTPSVMPAARADMCP